MSSSRDQRHVKARDRDPVVRAVEVAAVVWVVAFAVVSWLARRHAQWQTVISDEAYLVPIVGATVLSGVVAVRAVGRQRLFWIVLAASNAIWLAGEVVWSTYAVGLHQSLTFPSVADALYVASYLLVPVAIVLGFQQARARDAWHGVGSAMFVLAGVLVSGFAVLVEPNLDGGWSWASATSGVYPLLGLGIMVTFGAMATARHYSFSLPVRLVAVAFLVSAATDAAYTYVNVLKGYDAGSLIDVGWQLEAVLMCVAAVRWLRDVSSREADLSKPATDAQGGLMLLASAGTLLALVAGYGDQRVEFPTLLAAAGAVLVAQVRMYATARTQAVRNGYQAMHDALTRLPNRTLFLDRVEQAVLRANRDGEPFAVLLADLNRFKEVNDTLGHTNGDLLLITVADRMRGALRAHDTLARQGGDEYMVLLPGVDEHEAYVVASRLADAIATPMDIGGVTLIVSASTGIACAHAGGDAEVLLRRADVAMYHAKEQHIPVAVYDAQADRNTPMRLTLLTELRTALSEGQLELHYQPKVALDTGDVVGLESLVRWRHPLRGLIPPADFIPVVENTGLIHPLTDHVIRLALRDLRRWCGLGMTHTVSVNVSARCLLDTGFPERVLTLLGEYGVPCDRLVLELTESCILFDPDGALRALDALRAGGLALSIDDFGTGYSSMSYLKRLPMNELKIDRSFVADISRSRGDLTLVRSAIDLGHNLGLTVVAEGVEDAGVEAVLRDLGCDVGQGFYYSRPRQAPDIERWLEGRLVARSLAGAQRT